MSKIIERHPRDPELIKIATSKNWYYRGTPTPGEGEVMKSLGVETPGLAVQKKKEFLIEVRGVDKKDGTVLFKDLAVEVLLMQSTKAKNTHTMAKTQINTHLMPFFGVYPVSTIDEGLWDSYVIYARRITPGRKLEHDRRHLVMVMKRAFEKGLIKRPVKFRKVDAESTRGRVFSDDEITKLLAAAGAELKLQILMAFTMGMRKGEILGLTYDRVDLAKAVIKLRAEDTKTRRGREVPIAPTVLEQLSFRQGESPAVFGSRYDRAEVVKSNESAWAACKVRAGVEGRFHDLRHSFLTRAFRQPVNPALICDFAGLSMETAQKVYLHFTPDDKRAVAGLVGVPT